MAQTISKMETIQTAVDWLMEQMLKPDMYKIWPTLLERAKVMEKEQIINAYEIGFSNGIDKLICSDGPKIKNAEQYYKETYAK